MSSDAFDEPSNEPRPGAALAPWQWRLLLVPIALLALYSVGVWQRRPDYVALLWRDPMGARMTVGAGAALAIGVALFWGGSALLNRFARVPWTTGTTVAQVGLALVWVLVCLGVAFVVTIGPAAIQVQKNLLKG